MQQQPQPTQQQQQMIPVMPSFPPTNITTEQIQKCLDENKKLILAILDNQNLGKLAECAQYQALLQKNLMYLAAIADSQPQAPASMPAQQMQMAAHPAMQQGGFYMQQHPQAAAAAMAQQQGAFPPKMPLQFNSPHQMQDHHQQQQQLHSHQQAIQGQMAMRPGGANNGMYPRHPEASLGGIGGPPTTAIPSEVRAGGGNKQEATDAAAAAAGANRQNSSASGQGGSGGDGESSSYLKGSDEAK